MFLVPLRISLTLLAFFVCLVALSGVLVRLNAAGRVFHDFRDIPAHKVCVVLGTSDMTRQGNPSPFFRARMDGAARLFREKRCEFILVSGDNAFDSYNEPRKMYQALVADGVDPAHIVMDFAGFSTLDSMVRAKVVFGLDSCIVVTQAFQAERAVYIARSRGLDVWAYAVEDAGGMLSYYMDMREMLARVKALFDVRIFHTAPVFLGAPEEIG